MNERLASVGNENMCPIAVIVRDGKVLTGHRHYTKDKWKDISVWTIPGGRCDTDETLEQALRREVKEEVGISDLQICDFIAEVPGAKEGDVVPMFYCTTSEDAKLMEPEKFAEWRWVPIHEYEANGQYAGFNPPAREKIIGFLRTLS